MAAKTPKHLNVLFAERGQKMMKRREFFLSFGKGLLAITITGLFPSYLTASVSGKGGDRLVDFNTGLSKTRFEALLNQFFYINTEMDGVVAVKLLQVKGVKGAINHEQFSLFFTGPSSPMLTAGSYEVEHDRIGSLSLYLEPSEESENAPLYRADFSLLR